MSPNLRHLRPVPVGWLVLFVLSSLILGLSCAPRLNEQDPDPDDDDQGSPLLGNTFDILMVVDDSNSMARVQEELQIAFPVVLEALTGSGVSWQLGVTTTDIQNQGAGNQGNLRSDGPVGEPVCEPELVLSTSEPAAATALFRELVDVGVEGATDERGLHAAALALCKGKDEVWWEGLEELADDDPVRQVCGPVPTAERTCNEGAFRSGVPTLVVVVSDEGDATSWSTNLPPGSELSACIQQNEDDPNFGECDCRLGWWFDFFAGIGQQVTFVTVGPTYQLGSDELLLCDGSAASYPGPCNPFGSSVCGLDFYQQIACRTGGRFFPVEQTRVIDEPATCELADFQGVADELRDLLIGVGE